MKKYIIVTGEMIINYFPYGVSGGNEEVIYLNEFESWENYDILDDKFI